MNKGGSLTLPVVTIGAILTAITVLPLVLSLPITVIGPHQHTS